MKIHLLAVGKLKPRGLRDAVDDYAKRIQRYAEFREIELKDGSAAEVRARFAKALPARGTVVALEVEGKAMSSHQLSSFVSRCEQNAVGNVSFLIGGAYGLPPETSKAADLQLSLSKMILPHRLARVFLAEQIYRAFTILNNEPYSH